MKTNRKYEFTRKIKQQGSYLLHRIIAVCNFGNVWVAGETKVYDNA